MTSKATNARFNPHYDKECIAFRGDGVCDCYICTRAQAILAVSQDKAEQQSPVTGITVGLLLGFSALYLFAKAAAIL